MQDKDLLMLGLVLAVILVGAIPLFWYYLRKKPAALPSQNLEKIPEQIAEEKKSIPVVPALPSWQDRLRSGLTKGRKEVWGKLDQILSRGAVDEGVVNEMEEILYGADLGAPMVSALLEKIQQEKSRLQNGSAQAKQVLYQFLNEKITPIQDKLSAEAFAFHPQSGTKVFMIVGINGVGKTTTIGKLAHNYTSQGAKVVVGAADTFRAAAVDQLQIWCERAGATLVRGAEGSDPSGVAFEAVKKAQELGADICLIDTAGRLHTNKNLMAELSKVKKVLSKLDPSAPHATLLVLDAVTGTNGLAQAREFHQTLGLSGIVFTKCDGSSKAGSAVSIVEQLGVPIVFIGVGEGIDDLQRFSQKEYLSALLGLEA